jgi:predicted metal-dependent enzyme (double-stranded beta helix superfamily)
MDLDELVAQCAAAAEEDDAAAAVREVVQRAVQDDPFRISDLPRDRTGIVTLHSQPGLVVQHVVIPPGAGAPPHDHRVWATVGVYAGQEDNALFSVRDGRLTPIGGRQLPAGSVLALSADDVHAVTNPRDGYTAALHVYGGDLDAQSRTTWDADGAAQPLDPRQQAMLLAAAQAWEAERGRALTRQETSELLHQLLSRGTS